MSKDEDYLSMGILDIKQIYERDNIICFLEDSKIVHIFKKQGEQEGKVYLMKIRKFQAEIKIEVFGEGFLLVNKNNTVFLGIDNNF